jgi:hypothetical protein
MLPELGGRKLGSGYWELPYVRPPPYKMDFSQGEMVRYWRRLIRKATEAESGGAGVADIGLNRLIARHKSFARAKISRPEQAEADRALWAEVLEPVENFCGPLGSPGFSYPGDKTVRKPNCLGGVSLLREI